MSLSLYRASAPVYLRGLRTLSRLLDKAAAHATAQGIAPSTLIEARLAPDMFNLARQIQSASDAAKSGTARLAGLPVPSFPDVETTFDELQARIAKTVAFVESVTPEQIDSRAGEEIEMKAGGTPVKYASQDYLLEFSLPNFFFHVATTYDILRQQGLDIGKKDYLGLK